MEYTSFETKNFIFHFNKFLFQGLKQDLFQLRIICILLLQIKKSKTNLKISSFYFLLVFTIGFVT